MMRNRPKQHVRKLKSGKKVLVNRGVKPKRKRRMPKVYHGTTAFGAHDIKREGIKTSNQLKKEGNPHNTLSDLTDPEMTYFFREPKHAETWAEVAVKSSPFPNAKPYVVAVDIPEEELSHDTEMKFGRAVRKEGPVDKEKILDIYPVKPKFTITKDGSIKRVPD